jgi:NAD(P)H dehydrogenase (quinone)
MKTLVILCHPIPGSFNHSIASHILKVLESRGHVICFHDLYKEKFDPVLSPDEIQRKFSFDEKIQRYSRELSDSDGIIIIHPDWWGQPPALLKGWIDRVFRPGISYDYEGEDFMKKTESPLLCGKKALVAVTTNEKKSSSGHPLETVWQKHIFGFCGIQDADCTILYGVRESGLHTRSRWLKSIEAKIAEWESNK